MNDTISRSALLKDLEAWRNQLGIYTGDDPHERELWETVGGMLVQFSDNVVSAPALDVMPVVHGHWEKIRMAGNVISFKCSVCENHDNSTVVPGDYCWRCGARMDGDMNV